MTVRNLLGAKSAILVGTARNCGKTIKADIARFHNTLQFFNSLHYLIIESDSGDDTVSALTSLASEFKNFRFLSLGKLREKIPLRTARIAYCRNAYLAEIEKNPAYHAIDYVIMADLDGINTMICEEGFLSCWSRGDWDVCTANQYGAYYDVWALRHKIWCPNDCMAQHHFLTKYNVNSQKSLYAAIYSKMITIPKDSEWIEVDSAFGGLAIYRAEALKGAKYTGLTEEGEEVCEHTTLHAALKGNNRRIFINPSFMNTNYTEYSPGIYRWIKDMLKIIGRKFLSREIIQKIKSV